MDAEKKARLEAEGFVVTTVSGWLGLSAAEHHEIEIRLALSSFLRHVRERSGLTLARAARRLKTTPARLSRMESGSSSPSFDQLITSALTLGATFREVGEAIASWPGEPGVDYDAGWGIIDGPAATQTNTQREDAEVPARPPRRSRSAKAA
jgi:transcriptional regulator with XRE-family HTH domain